MEIVILLVVALGGMAAFFAGAVLLYFYLRSGRERDYYDDEPAVYGNLVQCPHCGYMNPLESAACLNCRQPLPRPAGYPAPASYAAPAPQTRMVPTPAPGVNPPPVPSAASLERTMPGQRSQAAPAPRPAPVPNRPAGMPHTWLEGARGAFQGQTAVVAQVDTLVGRSTVCDVQIYDPKVSRRHFQIRFANGAFFLQDQGSTRGTRINGEQVKAQRLHNGDRITLGDSELIFHVEA